MQAGQHNHRTREHSVSHLVTYDAADGLVFRKVEELHDAIALVEQLRNDLGLDRARIYRLEEVAFEFRPYFRVAIADGPAAAWGDPFSGPRPTADPEIPVAAVAPVSEVERAIEAPAVHDCPVGRESLGESAVTWPDPPDPGPGHGLGTDTWATAADSAFPNPAFPADSAFATDSQAMEDPNTRPAPPVLPLAARRNLFSR
jgi:hypothetical protein